ncbi:hypothetical protein ACJ41O_010806 [Fusarium nematophilum]
MNDNLEYRKSISNQFLDTTDRDLEAYFRVYDELLVDTDAHLLQAGHLASADSAPITHRDVTVAAQVIRENTGKTLHQITLDVQEKLQTTPSTQRANLAIRVAVRAMFMLDSAVIDSHGPGFTIGRYRHVSWQLTEPFHEFVSRCFCKSLQESESVLDALANKRSLKAWKLKVRSGITFKATDNIAQHLLLDADNGILYLFHHTSFLKAQLDRLQGHSPSNEEDGLACLTRRYKVFGDALDDFEYLYWGHRLAEIYDHVIDRPPKNWFERWINWQTSESNAFAIALAALVISIIVGCLSLGLSAVQIWIAWRAWKDSL